MPIRQLSPHLVNQIAAGEVVERPASVVKELLENALDAGARSIEIDIENGGTELVRIVDDGCGIPRDELLLAIAAHATSKIASAEDLEAVATLGFRGEAMASIASVSRFTLRSRTKDAEEGAELSVEGGTIGAVRPVAMRVGTSVEVRTLFFNVPARRKFLRADAAETARITESVEAIAVGHPAVAFTLRSNGRVLLALASTDEPKQRMLDVLGKELESELLEFEWSVPEAGGLLVHGFAGKPAIARPTAKAVRIHLNGRPIMDRLVLHAVKEAYRGLIDPARSPSVALFIEIDPREVDVNVHPAKTEVRFRTPQAVHQGVRRAIERTLRAANLVPFFELPKHDAPASPTASGFGAPRLFGSGIVSSFAELAALAHTRALERPEEDSARVATIHTPRAAPIAQLHENYIVTEDADGIVIVDQHALHERYMFELFFERLSQGDLESQQLLVPEIVECSIVEMDAAQTIAPLCARIGLALRPFGARTLAIDAVPSLFYSRGVDAVAFARSLLGKALEHGSALTLEGSLHEIVDMMACKAAVKAGDRLSEGELHALLALRESLERSTNCPHGRPTSLKISLRDLERRFGRS
ncbi:MAG: DNA mismatch repair endonuclease MutL [Phycisphaerales bacterium]|nr:DNA mismatch repair endonuclease MutL [Phycisphaerales bacterium]